MIVKSKQIGGEEMHNKIKISHLGDCTELWNSLAYNQNPQCTFGGFSVNLRTVKKEAQDTAVLAISSITLLNHFCTIADPIQRFSAKTVGELYDSGADVDVIFDPLSSSNLSWNNLDSFASRLEKFSDSSSLEELTRLEIQLLLQADAELQRDFISKLNAKQQQYINGWTHFHDRIADFWAIASEVCLGQKTDAHLYTHAQADWFDWLYFANHKNKQCYLDYLYTSFEDENYVEYPLSKKIDSLRRKLTAFSKHIQSQEKEEDQENWKTKFMTFLEDISAIWNDLWPTNTTRLEFDCPITQQFTSFMNKVEVLIFDMGSKHSLYRVAREISPQKQLDTINKIRKLLGNALSEWKYVLSQRENKEDNSSSNLDPITPDPHSSLDASEQYSQILESLHTLMCKLNEKAESIEPSSQNTSIEMSKSAAPQATSSSLSPLWQELASFAAKEFLRQSIAKNVSQRISTQVLDTDKSLSGNPTDMPLLVEKKK